MKIHNNIKEAEGIKNLVLTIGMFDGVHLGHQHILSLINKEANKINGESAILTFHPHPRIALNPMAELGFLSTYDEKINQLKKSKLNHLIIQPFNKEFASLTAEEFVTDLLVKKLNTNTLIIGHDHHFGKNREGNFQLLNQLSKRYHFNLIQIPAIKNLEIEISSTKIRNALLSGDLEFANKALNRNYSLVAKVVEGDKIGRTIGFPTANLVPLDINKIVPGKGVYAVKVTIKDKLFYGMCNIGTRPTISIDKEERRVEVNVFNFQENIYNQIIEIEFLQKIREEKKFNSLIELKNQIELDKHFIIANYLE